MRKTISLFQVRPPKPDPEALGVELIQRRLARTRSEMQQSQPVVEWLEVATAMWRLRQGSDGGIFNTFADEPTVDDYPHYPTRLSSTERDKIMGWVKNRVARMADARPLPSRLPKEECQALTDAAQAMRAVYLTEHQIDVAFAAVHAQFPWLGALTEKAWRIALRRAKSGLPVGVGAMLLSGPPGLGKSSWARAVADALTVPSLAIDVGATGGTFALQGVARGWGSAEKGQLVSTIINTRLGNPVVVLDEIDAGSTHVGTTRGSVPGIYKAMMGLIEPSTAKTWICPYYQVSVDMRHVSWVCTSNDFSHVEQALIDRMVVVELPGLTHRQLLDFASREAEKRFDGDFVEAIVEQISESLKCGHRPSLRHVVRLLNRVEDAVDRPLLN